MGLIGPHLVGLKEGNDSADDDYYGKDRREFCCFIRRIYSYDNSLRQHQSCGRRSGTIVCQPYVNRMDQIEEQNNEDDSSNNQSDEDDCENSPDALHDNPNNELKEHVCMYVCMYIFPNKSASFRHFRLGLKFYKLMVSKVAMGPSFLILFAVCYARLSQDCV